MLRRLLAGPPSPTPLPARPTLTALTALTAVTVLVALAALTGCSDDDATDATGATGATGSSRSTDDAWLQTDVCALEIPQAVLAAVADDPATVVPERDTTFADETACDFDPPEPPNGVNVRLTSPSSTDGDPRVLADGSAALTIIEDVEGGTCTLVVPAEPAWLNITIIGAGDDPCGAADEVAAAAIDQLDLTTTG